MGADHICAVELAMWLSGMCGSNCHTWPRQIHHMPAEITVFFCHSSQASALWRLGRIMADLGHIHWGQNQMLFRRLSRGTLKSGWKLVGERKDSMNDLRIPVFLCLWKCSYPSPVGTFPWMRNGLALNQDFSTSALLIFWSRSFFILGDRLVHCGLCSNISGLLPADPVSTALVVTTKISPDIFGLPKFVISALNHPQSLKLCSHEKVGWGKESRCPATLVPGGSEESSVSKECSQVGTIFLNCGKIHTIMYKWPS